MKEKSNDDNEVNNIQNTIKINQDIKNAKIITKEASIEVIKEKNEVMNNNLINKEIKKEEEFPDNKMVDNIKIKSKEKNTTKIFSQVITTGKEKINDIYLKKVKDLSHIFNYTSNYLSFISQIFKKISEPFYSKLSSSYINNVKPFLKYFKELINILSSFSEKLNILNNSVEDKKIENGEEDLIRAEINLNSSVKKLNVIFADVSSVISKKIKENFLSRPIFEKYDTIENKFEENFHKMLNLISKFEQFRIKYINEYNKKYLNVFNIYIQKYNELDNYLINMKDFFLIEYDIVNSANFCLKKVRKFSDDFRKIYDDSINTFCDYLEILKKMIKIYYEENKKIILPNAFSEKMLKDLEKLIGQDIRKNIEKKFCLKNIIEHYRDEALRNEINHLLLKYQDILTQNNILKNEVLKDLSNFNIIYFKSSDLFFNFLLSLIPLKYQVNYDEVIQFKTDIKRDCGLFKGWKECHLVISYQGHILFFDEETLGKNDINPNKRTQSMHSHIIVKENKTEIGKNNTLSDINLNLSVGKKDDKINKNNYEEVYEDAQVKYGISPEKLSIMYYKACYGIQKIANKKKKYLFKIWEKGDGNKKNKVNYFDALDQKNLDNILLELTETNIYDD